MIVMMMSTVLIGGGGSERNLCQLARGLRDRGHKVIVCCMRGGNLSERMSQEGFIVENLKIRRLCSYQGIKSFLKVIKIIKKQKVSAILSYHRDCDFMGFLLSAITRVAIVSTRRDMGYDVNRLDLWIYGIINPFFDGIAAVSESVKAMVLEKQGGGPDDISVIYNGVNLTSCAPENMAADGINVSEIDSNFIKVACIGNIRPIKGQIHFVNAVKIVAKRFPQARFFLIGYYNDERYGMELLARIKEYGLEDVFKMTGPVEQSRVPAVWKTMDIGVVPSLSEGMSNALLEAMAAGKPVIATAVGGNVEVVRNGETGYLVPPGDPVAMADGLNRLLFDPALRREMGLRARYWAEMNFSDEKMIENYEDLLSSVCLRRKGQRAILAINKKNRISRAATRMKTCYRLEEVDSGPGGIRDK